MVTFSFSPGVATLPPVVVSVTPPAGASIEHVDVQSMAKGLPLLATVPPGTLKVIASEPSLPAGLIQARPPSIWTAGLCEPPRRPRSLNVSDASRSNRTTPPPSRSIVTAESSLAAIAHPASTSSPTSRARLSAPDSVTTEAALPVAAMRPNENPVGSSPPPRSTATRPPTSASPARTASAASPTLRRLRPPAAGSTSGGGPAGAWYASETGIEYAGERGGAPSGALGASPASGAAGSAGGVHPTGSP
jgi:hypothetical protein